MTVAFRRERLWHAGEERRWGESELVLVDGWVYMKEAMALGLIGR